jgi:2-hydroxy-3-keto-5-methylthiopentenyl-1-phosphate phosphatase
MWRVVETAWQSGQISSRKCMQRQVELLRMSPEELDAAIRHVRIDPGFSGFSQVLQAHRCERENRHPMASTASSAR